MALVYMTIMKAKEMAMWQNNGVKIGLTKIIENTLILRKLKEVTRHLCMEQITEEQICGQT